MEYEKKYLRHIPLIGLEGQKKLAASKVVIVGAGALGSYSVYYLKKLGIEKIRVIDADVVELSDIPRTIYSHEDVGLYKVLALEKKYDVEGINARLDRYNLRLLDGFDLIIDGTDNLRTRFLINEYAVKNGIPWIYMSVMRTYGYAMGIIPNRTACYRCIFSPLSTNLPTPALLGIFSYTPAFAASIGTSIAKRILLNENIESDLICFDLENLECHKIRVEINRDCPVCIHGSYEFIEGKYDIEVFRECDKITLIPKFKIRLDLKTIAANIKAAEIKNNHIKFTENNIEIMIFEDGKMITKGCDENASIRLYTRYIGV